VRVLVVDDDDDIRLLLRLSIGGEEDMDVVEEVANGAAAIEAIADAAPDVVVLDLQMPGTDGLTALPLLRDRYPDAAVLVYSATGRRSEALAAGADAYVDKSTSLEGVVRAVRNLVSSR